MMPRSKHNKALMLLAVVLILTSGSLGSGRPLLTALAFSAGLALVWLAVWALDLRLSGRKE